MLVLTRKIHEQIQIGENITITILRLKGQAVRVGIDAPEAVRIIRGELKPNTGDASSVDRLDQASGADRHSAAHHSPLATASTEPAVERPQQRTIESIPARREPPSSREPIDTSAQMPRACHDRRFSGPLLAIATRRMRRRRANFIPEGRL